MTEQPPAHPIAQGVAAAARALRWAGALALAAILLSGVTIVGPDEVALRLRFGKLTGTTAAEQVHGPGLLLSLPYLVDEVVRVPVGRVHEAVLDAALASERMRHYDRMDASRDGYALTGDHNIVQLRAVAKYQIVDPVVWALTRETPELELRAAVVAALTRTVAEMGVDAVLVEGKKALATTAMARAQRHLDRPAPWVRLVALELTYLAPPPQVAQAFEEVQSAFVERKTRVEEARRHREQELPAAAADAANQVRQAEADEAESLARARGGAAAFIALVDQHRRDPAVVRQRLYREAMETAMAQVGGRVLVDPRSGSGRVLIPAEVDQGEWRGPK